MGSNKFFTWSHNNSMKADPEKVHLSLGKTDCQKLKNFVV